MRSVFQLNSVLRRAYELEADGRPHDAFRFLAVAVTEHLGADLCDDLPCIIRAPSRMLTPAGTLIFVNGLHTHTVPVGEWGPIAESLFEGLVEAWQHKLPRVRMNDHPWLPPTR